MPTPTSLTEADMRPGERLVAGRPYVFNADLLSRYLARQAVEAAPANLSVLTDEELTGLSHKAVVVDAEEGMCPGIGQATLRRCDAEYARRGRDSGGALFQQSTQAKEAA